MTGFPNAFAWRAACAADAVLATWAGPWAVCFAIKSGSDATIFNFVEGQVAADPGTPAFILAAPEAIWARFLEPVPPRHHHGIFAMMGEEFQHSDDVARLKGLVLWLAWDCGLTMDLQKPFMESPEDLKERLRRNAMVLALAQMIHGDDVVVDEARQSIGSLTSSEMGWLKEIQRLAHQCETVRSGWQLRIVSGRGGNRVYLMALNKDNDRIAFASEHLAVTRLQ